MVGGSATLGTYSTFKGNIMALASITVTTGVNIQGRALARTAAVTLDTDTINKSRRRRAACPGESRGASRRLPGAPQKPRRSHAVAEVKARGPGEAPVRSG